MLRVFNNTARYVDQCVLPETIIYTTEGPKRFKMGGKQKFLLANGPEKIGNVLEHAYDGDTLCNTLHSYKSLQLHLSILFLHLEIKRKV